MDKFNALKVAEALSRGKPDRSAELFNDVADMLNKHAPTGVEQIKIAAGLLCNVAKHLSNASQMPFAAAKQIIFEHCWHASAGIQMEP